MAPSADPLPSMPIRSSKTATLHPFAPLSRDEIHNAATLVRGQWPENTDFLFKAVTLEEPLKAEVIPYLDAERNNAALPTIDRKAMVAYYIRNTVGRPFCPLFGVPLTLR